MSNYSGAKCFSCGEVFKDGDDIVVCPDCGTPYHRACYQKEGKCINTELHENEGSWSARDPKGENIRCSRCGFENTPDRQVCRQCGLPLSEEGQSYDARRMSAFGQPELDPEKSGEEVRPLRRQRPLRPFQPVRSAGSDTRYHRLQSGFRGGRGEAGGLCEIRQGQPYGLFCPPS